MTVITFDDLDEEQFRRSIETRLRHGAASGAIDRLRGLLAPYAGPGGILPERFLTVTAGDYHLYGWDGLADAIKRHDRPGRPVTALSIAFGWPGEDAPAPDAEGKLTPFLEIGYYNDESFPFSQSTREDMLEGYSYQGCSWAGDYIAADSVLTLAGIDDLHGALAALEARLLSTDEPDPEGIRAGSLGACLLSVLLFQAVGERIARDGLPRPLCVTAGSSGVYPYFDAPVVGMPADAIKAAEEAEQHAAVDTGIPGPRYSSLLMTSIPRAKKRAVLVLEESANETANRIAALRGHGDQAAASAPAEEPAPEPLITPMPNGPLMVKKAPKPNWDFRDMLGSGELDPPAAAPEPADQAYGSVPDEPQDPVEFWALRTPNQDAEPAPEPGFEPYPSSETIEPDATVAPIEPVTADHGLAPFEPQQAIEPDLPDMPDMPAEPAEAEWHGGWDEPALAEEPAEACTAPPIVEPSLPAVEPEPEPDPAPVAAAPRFPVARAAPVPAPPLPAEPEPEPGFALYESTTQERLQLLVARHLPIEPWPARPEPEAPPEAAPEPAPVQAFAERQDRDDEPEYPTPPASFAPPPRAEWYEDEPVYEDEPPASLGGRIGAALGQAWSSLRGLFTR